MINKHQHQRHVKQLIEAIVNPVIINARSIQAQNELISDVIEFASAFKDEPLDVLIDAIHNRLDSIESDIQKENKNLSDRTKDKNRVLEESKKSSPELFKMVSEDEFYAFCVSGDQLLKKINDAKLDLIIKIRDVIKTIQQHQENYLYESIIQKIKLFLKPNISSEEQQKALDGISKRIK